MAALYGRVCGSSCCTFPSRSVPFLRGRNCSSSFCLSSIVHFFLRIAGFGCSFGLLGAGETVDVFEVLEFAGEQLNVEVHELVYKLLLLAEQSRPIFSLSAFLG